MRVVMSESMSPVYAFGRSCFNGPFGWEDITLVDELGSVIRQSARIIELLRMQADHAETTLGRNGISELLRQQADQLEERLLDLYGGEIETRLLRPKPATP